MSADRLVEALGEVPDGAVVAVGGYLQQNVPMGLVAALARCGARDLTVVAAPSASLGVEYLVAAGAVGRVICPYVGFEGRGAAPAFARAVEDGSVERPLCDQEILMTGLRAAGQSAPCGVYAPTGSQVEQESPLAREIVCPFTGGPLIAVAALELDLALLHAQRADGSDNLVHLGSPFLDLTFAQAARRVVAEVDDRSEGRTDGAPDWTPIAGIWTDAVVAAPGSAFPCASHGSYGEDGDAVGGYLERERAAPGEGARWLGERIVAGARP